MNKKIKEEQLSILEAEATLIARKKSVHVNLMESEHRILKGKLHMLGLTMQDYFSFLCRRFNNDDPVILEMIEEYKIEKRDQELEELRAINKKELYDAIERQSPLSNKEKD